MKSSIQSRVLALVGAGIVVAVGVLALLSRSSLLVLEGEVVEQHRRVAQTMARELSRAVAGDMRLLAIAAGAEDDASVRAALDAILRYGRVSSAAFVVAPDGAIAACEPSTACGGVLAEEVRRAAIEAIATQRPVITDRIRASRANPEDPAPHPDDRIVCLLPLRALEGRPGGAAGLMIDPGDRRFSELLQPAAAPTLRVTVVDSGGHLLASAAPRTPGGTASLETTAPVPDTTWVLRLFETGTDPIAPIDAFRTRSLWLAPSLAAITMLLGWGIARSVRQPIATLTADAERIASGNLDRPIAARPAARGGDEVGRLAVALEEMRAALKKSIDTIEQSNAQLERRVQERTRQLAEANAALEERERVRQQLLRKVISAQEDERKRVARELHDETSQTLAALGIGVDMALASCHPEINGQTHRRLEDIRRLVDRMHHELHRMIVNLRPSVLDDLGLAAAIQWFAERQLPKVAVRCEIEFDTRLPSELETAIFRAVQESIVNIARHAHAESVLIQGSIEGGTLTVEIEDDGDGFKVDDVVRAHDSMRGVGLLGMRERLEIFGGTLTIDSDAGEGTRVVMRVPV
ncbi:MAG TPA: ATP-binding protein [Vicinamibacterales bacterium]